jgi:Aromatic amino acid lyase
MIRIGEKPLTLEDIRAALQGPIQVEFTDEARSKIVRSAETVARLLGTGDAIYGVNTGFGKLAKTRIAPSDLAALQINIVRSHAAGGSFCFSRSTPCRKAHPAFRLRRSRPFASCSMPMSCRSFLRKVRLVHREI